MRTLGRGCLLALALCAGCLRPPDDGPGVGSPGLEPPSGGPDAGGVVPGLPRAGSTAMAPDSSSSGQTGGQPTSAGGSGGGGGAFGHAGTSGAPVPPPGDPGQDAGAGLEVDGGVLDPESALFAGLWVIEQPFHALYEATLYELDASFAVRALETTTLGAPLRDGYVTGTVATELGVICSFEGNWLARGPLSLELDSRCTDGATRVVRLQFPDGGDPAVGVVPAVVSVDGEANVWSHRDFAWVWRKCPSRADCAPFSM